MDRITKEMVCRKFSAFCLALGVDAFFDEEWDRNRSGLFLDMSYRNRYVVRHYTPHGSILTPFGLKHRTAAEMWDALDFATVAVELNAKCTIHTL